MANQTAQFDRATVLSVTENILQAHPDITGIFAENDEMALGAMAGGGWSPRRRVPLPPSLGRLARWRCGAPGLPVRRAGADAGAPGTAARRRGGSRTEPRPRSVERPFLHPSGFHVDQSFERLESCHTIDLAGRLDLVERTLPPADRAGIALGDPPLGLDTTAREFLAHAAGMLDRLDPEAEPARGAPTHRSGSQRRGGS